MTRSQSRPISQNDETANARHDSEYRFQSGFMFPCSPQRLYLNSNRNESAVGKADSEARAPATSNPPASANYYDDESLHNCEQSDKWPLNWVPMYHSCERLMSVGAGQCRDMYPPMSESTCCGRWLYPAHVHDPRATELFCEEHSMSTRYLGWSLSAL